MNQVQSVQPSYATLNRNNHLPLLDSALSTALTTSDSTFYHQLAHLSQQKQWILYTADCPRPQPADLAQYAINCSKVIHLNPSSQLSEEEVVLKALRAKTASAIVASAALGELARARIQRLANLQACKVFFLNHPNISAPIHH